MTGCSLPCTDLIGSPINGSFYFQAFSGSVTLATAGYDYDIDWTPMSAGLAPARTAASLAARYRPERKLPGGSISHWEIAPLHGARSSWVRLARRALNIGSCHGGCNNPCSAANDAMAMIDGSEGAPSTCSRLQQGT